MKNIITIQHTQSVHHTNGMVGSWTDWDITDLGIEQAKNIGKNLSKEINGKAYVMYTSDLLRAKHTAEIVGNCLEIHPKTDSRLKERNLGTAVGKTVEWMRQNMICQEKSIDDRMFIDAESRRDVWNRILPFYNGVTESQDENIILVSHGDWLSIFNAIWLGMKPDMLNKCDLFGKSGGVSFMQQTEDGKHIIFKLSDMSYIK